MEKKPRQALHRGLMALISPEALAQNEPVADAVPATGALQIPLTDIEPNPFQPRRVFDPAALDDLKNSILEHGVIEPVIVRRSKGKYELVSGERRLMASRAAGLAAIPAVLKDKVSDREMRVLALVENLQRADLNDIEVALGYQELIAQYNYIHDQVAAQTGKSRTYVTNTLRLLKLPEEMQDALVAGKISAGHARAILAVNEPADRSALFNEILSQGLSVRQAETWGSAAPKKPAPATRDPKTADLAALEAKLAQLLGTRVEIRSAGRGGKLVIKFVDVDDLNRIASRLEELK